MITQDPKGLLPLGPENAHTVRIHGTQPGIEPLGGFGEGASNSPLLSPVSNTKEMTNI